MIWDIIYARCNWKQAIKVLIPNYLLILALTFSLEKSLDLKHQCSTISPLQSFFLPRKSPNKRAFHSLLLNFDTYLDLTTKTTVFLSQLFYRHRVNFLFLVEPAK